MFEHFLPSPNDAARRRLARPFLSDEAAQLIERATTTQVPVHFQGPPGCGLHELASALHALRGGGRFVVLPVGGLGVSDGRPRQGPPAPTGSGGVRRAAGTAFIPAVDRASDDAQHRIEALLDAVGRVVLPGGACLHLVTAAHASLIELADEGLFSVDLAHRLTVLPVEIVPVRERPDDLPLLVEHIVADVAGAVRARAPRFDETALERMKHHSWPGDLAELRAVIARTLALHRGERVRSDDLLFDRLRFSHAFLARPAAPVPPAAAASGADRTLDLLAQELAHELKNPMVTIKTFAQLAGRVASGEADMAELARLAGEAVDRMDAVVENLLRYTRFGPPAAARVALSETVAAALDELAGVLPLEIEHEAAPSLAVEADREQLEYAFANLLRGLAGSPPVPLAVAIRYRAPAVVRIEPRAAAPDLVRRLKGLVVPEGEDAADLLPLGVALARALVERNGGKLVVEPTHVAIELVPALNVEP